MKWILTAGQAGSADARAAESGIPAMVLMERAALSVLRVIDEEHLPTDRVLVVSGMGNNGGDGIAVARLLYERGCHPLIFLSGNPEKMSGQMKEQMRIIGQYNPEFTDQIPADRTLIIDALFGTGLHRPVAGEAADVVRAINDSGAHVLSVDIASGVFADSGKVPGTAVRADETVTFSFAKRGHYFFPGAEYTGKLHIMPIGITPLHIDRKEEVLTALDESDLSGMFPRDESGNKGTFGKVLVIAGSAGIYGAAYLSSLSALKAGTGMVRVFTEEANRTPLACAFPEALITTYRDGSFDRNTLEKAIGWSDLVLAGPGLGTGGTAGEILRFVLEHSDRPLVMDADALNILSRNPVWWEKIHVPCAVTPHVAEMSRISKIAIPDIQDDPVGTAKRFASGNGVTCVLKDARTVVAAPSGRTWLNTSGCSALATAGSGDVLSGLLAGLLTRRLKQNGVLTDEDLSECAAAACFIHGLSGEKAAAKASESFVTASEIIENLHFFV